MIFDAAPIDDIPQKPIVAIFLDIDGVLIRGEFGDFKTQKLHELFGKRDYSGLEYDIATSYFLSESAVVNLDRLIERVSEVAEVVIILSSAWRINRTVDEIKNQIFKNWSFSKYIIDKTPDNFWRSQSSLIALEKYGFELRSRDCQIDYWLRENKHLQIKNFVILDDCDEGLSERFPYNFVHVRWDLFTEEHANKAYEVMVYDLISNETLHIMTTPSPKGEDFLPSNIL